MQKGYNIFKTVQTEKVWSVPNCLMNRFNLKENDFVTLKFGSATTSAKVIQLQLENANSNLRMGLSSAILNSLNIPNGVSLLVKSLGNNIFCLGPVIGILTFTSHITNNKLHYYNNYAHLIKDKGLLYIFSGTQIDSKNNLIKGYHFDYSKNAWILRNFPFPDVVIDRCYPNNQKYHNLLEPIVGNKIFNKNSMLDKMEIFNILNRNSNLKTHLPETELFESASTFEQFLEKHETIYLKPTNSMNGFGIIQAQKVGKSLVECNYLKNKSHLYDIIISNNISKIVLAAAGRERPYIVQQAISSTQYNKGPFSIRTWAMKNRDGQWTMPGMYATGTLGKSFLTNLSAGGKLVSLEALLKKILPLVPYTKYQLISLLDDLTLETASTIEKKYGRMGELGIDFMIDHKGKIWLIEVNGNPGKNSIFKQSDYFSWPLQVYQYPVEYATYLAGFGDSNAIKRESPCFELQSITTPPKDQIPNKITDIKKIKTMVVISENDFQEIGTLEIMGPAGVGVDKTTGDLTTPIEPKCYCEPVTNPKVIKDELIHEGYIPIKLIFSKDAPLELDFKNKLDEQFFIPFKSVVKIDGIKPGDQVQEKITVESLSIQGIPVTPTQPLEESRIRLVLKAILKAEVIVTREYIIAIPAQICDTV